MPYIVELNTGPPLHNRKARHAYAELSEAREAAKTLIIDGPYRYGVDSAIVATYHLPATGGVIGPLADGYVIDVQHKSWQELAAIVWPDSNGAVHPGLVDGRPDAQRTLLDAFNA